MTPACSIACKVALTDLNPPVMAVAERLAGGRERIVGVEIDHGRAVVQRAGQIDAELLEDVALDFGDDHLEHDLVAAANDDGVDDFAASRDRIGAADAEQPRRDIVGLLRLGLARRGAGENDAVADAFDRDIGIRQNLRGSPGACR